MKVFISGTTADLGRFRKAAADQLSRLNNVEPIEQSDFGVDHRELPTLLKDKIASCDAVICLVGSVFGACPPGLNRSYTQMEYYFAKELHKHIFLFFPSDKCRLDWEGQETAEQLDLQKKHVELLQSQKDLWSTFDDEAQVRWMTAEAVFTISPEAAGGKIARSVRTDFPTPLALLFDQCIGSQDQHKLSLLIGECLRFTSLLALHDSAVHRVFGCQSADTAERIRALPQPERLSDWHSLLRLACPEEGDRCGARFIPEFTGWEGRISATLANVVRADDKLVQRKLPDRLQIVDIVRKGMSSVLADLDFFRRYVLLGVTAANPDGKCVARILRGLAPNTFEFNRDPQSPLQPMARQLYLLSVDRRRALYLTPSFSYASTGVELEVYGYRRINADGNGALQLEYEAFDEYHPPITVSEQPDIRGILSDWLGGELCQHAFGFQTPVAMVAWEGKLLDDVSWEKLQKELLPEVREPSVLGGRFRLKDSPIHRGLHADVFEATDITLRQTDGHVDGETPTVPTHPVVHVLRAEGTADEEVREWFANRARWWRQTQCRGVLRLYEPDDPTGKAGIPFLLTERVLGAISLEHLIQSEASLSGETVLKAVRLAAEACRVAHQHGVFLLALPLRHFLVDANGNLHLTGFEAALSQKPGDSFPLSLQKHLRRFSKEQAMPERMTAPELERDHGVFSVTLDVFAIGALLQRLRGRPVSPMPLGDSDEERDDAMWRDWRKDPWECFVYHCLARDPNRRFQSIAQCAAFIERCAGRDRHSPMILPELVPLGDRLSISRFPVMNFEFECFCQSSLPRRLPPTLNLSYRYCGPFAPVVNVSLRDAMEYSHWLTTCDPTGAIWRLPYEAEWLRAAMNTSEQGSTFPWGNAHPSWERANYFGKCHGPTVVGSHPDGSSWSGCQDLSGNVWEWCQDRLLEEPKRLLKGGSYSSTADELRLSVGQTRLFCGRYNDVGFRVIKEES